MANASNHASEKHDDNHDETAAHTKCEVVVHAIILPKTYGHCKHVCRKKSRGGASF
jgi:hypothetical protein